MERPLTQHIDPSRGPLDLKAYREKGGYEAVKKALGEMEPPEITELVKESNLKGRGGAGFGTGMKWGFVNIEGDEQRYIIANADEMEPGTFKDRLLLEQAPHSLIEGMIISAYAIQATKGYIFLRWAYKSAAKRLQKALDEAREAGFLGKDIQGSGFDLEITLHTSVGRYMCGEETGLLNALEGGRATPRAKPPFPQASGLFGQPTIVNNVETLCNIPHIVNNGAEWFINLSKTDEGGTKLYGASGRVKRPGIWELPLGTTLREILEEHAGGMKDGYEFKGALPGGASTDFIVAEHFDKPLDYANAMDIGTRLGTGTVIVLDDKTSVAGFLKNLQKFFAQESCGWCTPCRDGLPWIAKTLEAIENGNGRMADIEMLEQHTKLLAPGSTFCMLAPGAMEPLQSALKYFREDLEKLVKN